MASSRAERTSPVYTLSAPIRALVFADRVEISNPGHLSNPLGDFLKRIYQERCWIPPFNKGGSGTLGLAARAADPVHSEGALRPFLVAGLLFPITRVQIPIYTNLYSQFNEIILNNIS
jgi:hypothetical protein